MGDFAQRMVDILIHGALNLAMAMGYKSQLFNIFEELTGSFVELPSS
jgi:hypothetical protein